jgi:hypothetical protein
MHRKPFKDLFILMLISLCLLPTYLANSIPISTDNNSKCELGALDSDYACIKPVPNLVVFVNL